MAERYPQRGGAEERSMTHGRNPSVGDAVSQVVDSTQRLLRDQIQLLKADGKALMQAKAKGGALLAAAAVVGLFGYVLIMVGIVVLLAGPLGYAASLVIVGGVHAVGGGVAALLGARNVRQNPLREDLPRLKPTLTEARRQIEEREPGRLH